METEEESSIFLTGSVSGKISSISLISSVSMSVTSQIELFGEEANKVELECRELELSMTKGL